MNRNTYRGSNMYYYLALVLTVAIIVRVIMLYIRTTRGEVIGISSQMILVILNMYLILKYILIAKEYIVISNKAIEKKGLFITTKINNDDIKEIIEEYNRYFYIKIKDSNKSVVINILDIRKSERNNLKDSLKAINLS